MSSQQALRNEIFQKLKPRCVELSQYAIALSSRNANPRTVVEPLRKLLEVLQEVVAPGAGFDDKLADYVFFPISHVFRHSQQLPDRAAELALQVLRVLLATGWRQQVPLDLAKQLLLLLTFIIGGKPDEARSKDVSEEVSGVALESLGLLFQSLGRTPKGPASLIETATVPALGHCVTVVLDVALDSASTDLQYGALKTLQDIYKCIKDHEVLASFFPGTVSSLTKSLRPTTQSKRPPRVLVAALQTLDLVLHKVIGDINVRAALDGLKPGSIQEGKAKASANASWLKATRAQVKLALANVVKLRDHDRVEVRNALAVLCIGILDKCHASLSDSSTLMVETLMILSSDDNISQVSENGMTLKDLATIYSDLAELIKASLHGSITSLPRVMQGNDEGPQQQLLKQMSRALALLSDLGISSDLMTESLMVALTNSITEVIHNSPQSKVSMEVDSTMNPGNEIALSQTNDASVSVAFQPLLLSHGGQQRVYQELEKLLTQIVKAPTAVAMARGLLDSLRHSSGNDRLSSFWLCSRMLSVANSTAGEDPSSVFLDLEPLGSSQELQDIIGEELYSYAVSLLVEPSMDASTDWRLQGVALEAVAFEAAKMQMSFRAELVDVLYPIVHLVGSSSVPLRQHAIACLNSVTKSCGYHSAGEMIVENVDYLVNAVALKLNTFDISPQAPQVLLMMIKLSGPTLLPYLDDVVSSIFAALDNFHGYPRLVELLFTVLGEIVSVGSKANVLAIPFGTEPNHRKQPFRGPTIEDVATLLQERKTRKIEQDEDDKHEAVPQEPWKSAKDLLDDMDTSNEPWDNAEDKQSSDITTTEEKEKPPDKVYIMVQNIARLSQHYLTHSSPVLRRKLLRVAATASTALSLNENQFLPLVNELWPVVIARLYDPEPFVTIAAADAVAELCCSAGDFLTSRIETEWPRVRDLVWQTRKRGEEEQKGRSGRGGYSQNQQVWEALVRLLVTVVEFVRIDDEIFDEVIDMLEELIPTRSDVREALSIINADAVWLVLEKRKPVGEQEEPPALEGFTFVPLSW